MEQATKTAVEKVTKTGPDMEVRVCRKIEIGSVLHQGDVYVHCVESDHPRGKEVGSRQVAVGSTVGARHVAEGAGVKVFEGKLLPDWVTPGDFQVSDLLGPVIVADDTWNLAHPEHAHHSIPAGTYQITYQGDWATKTRVLD